jgi:hypothetical protein
MHISEKELLQTLGAYHRLTTEQGRKNKADAALSAIAEVKPFAPGMQSEYDTMDEQIFTILLDYLAQSMCEGEIKKAIATGRAMYHLKKATD